jgi:hypothetical protein
MAQFSNQVLRGERPSLRRLALCQHNDGLFLQQAVWTIPADNLTDGHAGAIEAFSDDCENQEFYEMFAKK